MCTYNCLNCEYGLIIAQIYINGKMIGYKVLCRLKGKVVKIPILAYPELWFSK